MMTTIPIISTKRSCGDCTLCCEGWLGNVSHGYEMWPGRKCQFVSLEKGCTIYDQRPDTCQKFECQWLSDERIPEWMKPNKCGVIIREREIDGVKFLEILEAGQKLDSEILSWALNAMTGRVFTNLKYQVSSGWNYFGTEEFFKMIKKNFG
jgi:hypothetical protein